MAKLVEVSSSKSFGGFQKVFKHFSKVLSCEMNFGIYQPPNYEYQKNPVIFWLSGLTCTEQNFITKAGAQQYAAKYNVVVVCPDTSPRNCDVSGENESYDLGTGASFYVDSTQEPWKKNYQMFSYVTKELPELIADNFKVDIEKQSIMGHSMGGHGALVCHLRNPGKYKSCSALAPICNPTKCKWGRKVFAAYLGGANPDSTETPDSWKNYDATYLTEKYDGPPNDILIDQGTKDEFLDDLMPKNFVEACKESQIPVILQMREGYDHGYYFISTFMENHFKHHAKYLEIK